VIVPVSISSTRIYR